MNYKVDVSSKDIVKIRQGKVLVKLYRSGSVGSAVILLSKHVMTPKEVKEVKENWLKSDFKTVIPVDIDDSQLDALVKSVLGLNTPVGGTDSVFLTFNKDGM